MIRYLALAIVLWLHAPYSHARADDAHPSASKESKALDAVQLYESGVQALEAENYEVAEKLFTKGFELTKKSAFLWNMAEVARMRGDMERARDLYHRYLDVAPNGSKRSLTLERLAALPPETQSAYAARNPQRTLHVDYSNSRDDRSTKKPIFKKWWFWTTTAAVVGGSIAAVFVIKSKNSNSGSADLSVPSGGTLGPAEATW